MATELTLMHPRLGRPESEESTPSKRTRQDRAKSVPQVEKKDSTNRQCIPEVASKDVVYMKVINFLHEPLAEESGTHFGCVYIFPLPQRPEIMKIGFSADRKVRFQHHKKQCDLDPPEETVWVSEILYGPWAKKVERLAQRELGFLQRRSSCDEFCTTIHNEYFEVGLKEAKTVVERWIRFVKAGAYDKDRRFNRNWRKALREHLEHNQPFPELGDYDTRHDWWEELRRRAQAANAWKISGWQFWCIFEAIVMIMPLSVRSGHFAVSAMNLVGVLLAVLLVQVSLPGWLHSTASFLVRPGSKKI